MTTRTVALTLACVVMLAVGQILFKAAAGEWRLEGSIWRIVQSFFSARMVFALVIYGVATVLWVYVLRTAPLASSYLLFSLAFVIVPILSHFVFGERIGLNTLAGGGLIMAGIIIASR
ncbi:MAG: EamA family transporter [Pseudomonadota bacterium]|nr:EamA family transporter [Pseudomonadota bacterium]